MWRPHSGADKDEIERPSVVPKLERAWREGLPRWTGYCYMDLKNQVLNDIPNQGLDEILNRRAFHLDECVLLSTKHPRVGGFPSYGRRWMVYGFSSLQQIITWKNLGSSSDRSRVSHPVVPLWSMNDSVSSNRMSRGESSQTTRLIFHPTEDHGWIHRNLGVLNVQLS